MDDKSLSVESLKSQLRQFAAELLEPFQWLSEEQSRNLSPEKREAVRKEIADKLDIDLLQAARDKIVENTAKYPVEKAKGSMRKYTDL